MNNKKLMDDDMDFKDTRNESKKKNSSKLNFMALKAKANILEKKETQREHQKLVEAERQKALQVEREKEKTKTDFGKRKTGRKRGDSGTDF